MDNIPRFGGPKNLWNHHHCQRRNHLQLTHKPSQTQLPIFPTKFPAVFFLIRIFITFWNYVSLMVGNQHVFTMPICPWKMVKRWTFKTHQLPSLQPSLSTWSTFTWNLISTCHVDDLKGFSGERWQERWWVFRPKTPPPLMKAEHRWCLKWIGNH